MDRNDFDVLPCGYVSFRDDGIVTQCNGTLASWLGSSKEDLIGHSIENIFTLATRIFYNTHFFPLVKLQSRASEIFLSLKGKDDLDVPVLANAHRSIDDGGDYIIHCIFVRVEQRKKYEQEILNAKREAEHALKENKQLSEQAASLEQQAIELDKLYQYQLTVNENLLQFGKIISHDLQEPIRKIQVFLDLMVKDSDSVISPRSQSWSRKIEAAAEKLKTLTNGLQQYVAIDSEKLHAEVNLNAVIDAARNRAISFRQFADFDMEVEEMPVIEGYGNQLELLFFNLIDNAIQFRSSERKLSIKISGLTIDENIFRMYPDRYKYTEHLKITFLDNGIGFSEQYNDYVFELLSKLQQSSSGLGLGLPLVKKIVLNHSGQVRAESQMGIGTRFEIYLPAKIKTLN